MQFVTIYFRGTRQIAWESLTDCVGASETASYEVKAVTKKDFKNEDKTKDSINKTPLGALKSGILN